MEPSDGFARPELDTRLNRGFAFLIGALLAVTTLKTRYVGTPEGLIDRIVPVDLLCAAFLVVLFFRHRMVRLPVSAIVFIAAVFLSLLPALAVTRGPAKEAWTYFAAMLMAVGFYVAGLHLGGAPRLLKAVLAGVCVAVFAETVIVVHDVLFANQWFPDPMEGRARGTFKANGQLGAFGFCAAGLLIALGAAVRSPAFTRWCIVAGLAAASFVFFASRRAGMIAVAVWAVLFLVIGRRSLNPTAYRICLGTFVAALVMIGAFWPQISSSFVGRRFTDAIHSLQTRDGFVQSQLRNTADTVDQWFPFGFGAGRGYWINPKDNQEVHNGILAVAVEFGVLGLAGYLCMLAPPLIWGLRRMREREPDVVAALMVSFMLACLLFMFHNTLFRDRTFLLFLGTASAYVASRATIRRAPPVVEPAKPVLECSSVR